MYYDDPNHRTIKCSRCKGKGEITVYLSSLLIDIVECLNCFGEGQILCDTPVSRLENDETTD